MFMKLVSKLGVTRIPVMADAITGSVRLVASSIDLLDWDGVDGSQVQVS
jgi:hypothetical protein